ncbi:MAG: hypothetical protein AB7R89_14530 [Dehalococcoidia bacterium]
MTARLAVAGVIAGVAAVLVLVVVVVIAGRFDPSPPSLQRHSVPAIPGEILYVDTDGCIVRARASGESRERVTCVTDEPAAVAWVDADTIGFLAGRPGQTWTELDLKTGEERLTALYPQHQPPNAESVRGEGIDIDDDGSVYRVNGDERTRIFDFDGPEHRRPQFVTWSPDGDWILLRYEEELWIVSRDGSIRGTLASTRPFPYEGSWWIDGHGSLPRLDLQPSGR